MTRPIAFVDCETTSLRPDRRAWEIAVILRRPGQPDHERSWLVSVEDLDLGNADPQSLRIGGFYDRHPELNPHARPAQSGIFPGSNLQPESTVLRTVESLTRNAVIYGSNPAFDMDVLDRRMRAHGLLPSWHYRGECVATAAKWWLRGRGLPVPESEKSDDLSRAVGVDPAVFDRHTALGDCQWVQAMFDAIHAPVAV
jgi:DNA polymerase III epsilon subunit-like protein